MQRVKSSLVNMCEIKDEYVNRETKKVKWLTNHNISHLYAFGIYLHACGV